MNLKPNQNTFVTNTSMIKNLIIYKKAMYNADTASENELLEILNPVLKSESVWKSHALLLMADYFLHNNNLIKSRTIQQIAWVLARGRWP